MEILDWSEKGQKLCSASEIESRGESVLKSNGLSKNGRVINYTQLMESRQASIENVIKGAGNYDGDIFKLAVLKASFKF